MMFSKESDNWTFVDIMFAGAHTLGVGHCQNFANRLYPQTDPTMPLVYSLLLKTACPAPFATNTLTPMPIDSTTLLFDNRYYNDIKVNIRYTVVEE